jgi:hypothetical protein
LIVVLMVFGVGGYFAFNWLNAGKTADGAATPGDNTSGSGTTGVAPNATREVGRYWLELLPLSGEENLRVAGVVPLASEQNFKFHFQLAQDGYLYIVGPGERNLSTAFLTTKPAAVSGVESNQVRKNADFSFPSGLEHWLQLDKKAGTENYTVVFSPVALSSPAFFNEQVTGEPLTEAQQAELSKFLAQYPNSEPAAELNDKNSAEPFMQIRISQRHPAEQPIVFRIRIEHK